MNTHVAYTLYTLHPQATGNPYIEHHFGWQALAWAIGCIVALILLGKLNGRGHFVTGALSGILMLVAIVLLFGAAILMMMWIVAMGHQPGNM
ncbi:MAG: hypothetical protein ACREGB_03085 [Candidatus Saccharimonadales bacterium]